MGEREKFFDFRLFFNYNISDYIRFRNYLIEIRGYSRSLAVLSLLTADILLRKDLTVSSVLTIDPITRIEGHLGIRLEIESGRVANAFCSGEMFRGFELILKGRDPLDAQQIVQRICGVCPVSHGLASVLAQEIVYKCIPAENGRLIRNIILGANYIQSHIVHFYHLSLFDFADIQALNQYQGTDPGLHELKKWLQSRESSKSLYPAAPFLPRYDCGYIENTELNLSAVRHYFDALNIRALAHKFAAVFAGKLPHSPTLVPGGVTEKISAKKIAECRSMIKKLQIFIEQAYLEDVSGIAAALPEYFRMGRGCGKFLAYGVFPESEDLSLTLFPSGLLSGGKLSYFDADRITEDVRYALYSSPSGLKPDRGQTFADPQKDEAYSWIKAPRYDGAVMEVGPLARMMIACLKGENTGIKRRFEAFLQKHKITSDDMISVMGRHAARALECKIIADRCEEWIELLKPDEPVFMDFEIPPKGQAAGLTEAPRGALGHWIELADYKIKNYQCVVPTTWNCSPRDDRGIPGPVEQALAGTPIADSKNPIEAVRVVRSFDPCIACAVH